MLVVFSLGGCGEATREATAADSAVAEQADVAVNAGGASPAFAQCRSCHSTEPGRHGIGPSLHGIFGSKAAKSPGFEYSAALQKSDITWDKAALDRWLANPRTMVPGTTMITGVANPAGRQAIADYLETLETK